MFIPVFYLYILSITTPGFRFKKIHIRHFVPAISVACLNIPYLLTTHTEKLDFISHGYGRIGNSNIFSYLLIIYMIGILGIFSIQLIFYSVLAFRLYQNHKTYIENRYSFTERISLDWILALIVCFVIFFVFNDILYLVGFRQHIITQMLYNIAMLGTTFYIGYRGMIQIDMKDYSIYTVSDTMLHQIETKIHTYPFIHSALPSIKENLAEEPGSITDEKSDNLKKYSGSSLTQPQKEILIQKLQNVMQYEKIFIDDKLSIEDVAIKLNSNTKYISQIINETFNKNFYNFINSYRIEAAKELLLSQENDKYSILGIAQTVGFVSKSAFNVSFKKFTGQTPTEFKRKGGIPI